MNFELKSTKNCTIFTSLYMIAKQSTYYTTKVYHNCKKIVPSTYKFPKYVKGVEKYQNAKKNIKKENKYCKIQVFDSNI